MKQTLLLALLHSAMLSPAVAGDFGLAVDSMLQSRSMALFGIVQPLQESAAESVLRGYRTPSDTPDDLLALAAGLKATFLTRDAADLWDQMAFFPPGSPTHLIACVESGRLEHPSGKLNPGVQRIALAGGPVETIVRGTDACDGIRTTPWGTILLSEEAGAGAAYELLDPLAKGEIIVLERDTGETSDPARLVKRTALPVMHWEGLAILPSGVIYAGDELRPGAAADDADGGALFKFVPEIAYSGGPLANLSDSPLAAGTVYALRVSCRADRVQFGQGCETGMAGWVEVDAARARKDADAAGATGFYRPEDLQQDPAYPGPAVRLCFSASGNARSHSFGEVICVVDRDPMATPQPDRLGGTEFSTEVSRFIEGDADFNSFDNLDFQPGTGNLYVIEDHPNGDIFACLPDGADRDLKTDGCIRVLSVKDSSAEPTGFIFAPDGMTAYLSIQHSDDSAMPLVDDYPTDDVLVISGFATVVP